MLIAIINQSTLVTAAEAAAMTQAIATQVKMDVAPIWDRAPAAVVFFPNPRDVPETAHGIAIVDNIEDQPQGTLGFHTDQGGKLWGVVAAKPEIDNGAKVSTGDWSVSSVLSHEVLEMFIDPNCNLWADDGKGSAYSFEVCDPVEAPTYSVSGVSVSNFVTPAWFDPQFLDPKAIEVAQPQFDKLGLVKVPFGILPGGYVVYESAGKSQQKSGADYPPWRQQMKSGSLARTKTLLRAHYGSVQVAQAHYGS